MIEGIISKGANISSVTKFGDMFKVIENNMKTNMSFDDMWTVMTDYKNARSKVTQHELKGTGSRINNIYYYKLDEASLASVEKRIKRKPEIIKNSAYDAEFFYSVKGCGRVFL